MVTIDINSKDNEVISEVRQLFPESEPYELCAISGSDVVPIITSVSTLLTVFASSQVLVQFLKNKVITIKVGDIEYTGRPEDMPDFLKQMMKDKKG